MKRHLYIFHTIFITLILLLAGCGSSPETIEPTPPVAGATATLPLPTPTVQSGRASSFVFAGDTFPTPTPLPEPTAVVPVAESDRLNNWLTITVPSGWERAAGPHGMIIARNLDDVPGTPLLQIRRWLGVINLESWRAYLPDGVAERNSNATINMGGREWGGLFIFKEGEYRAFFAVSQEQEYAYSLLVYVPALDGLSAEESFDREAPTLNQMLRTAQRQ